MHRLPDKKAAISSLQREDGGEMKIVQEGSKASNVSPLALDSA
jgi:hypothetical protein